MAETRLGTSCISGKRAGQGFIEDTNGVSPIIGSVLLVGIVMLVVGAFMSPIFLPNIQEAEPNAKFVITHDGQDTATVKYWNGDTLQANQVTILVGGKRAASQFSGAIRPGDSKQITAQSGENVQVIWVSSDGTRSSLLGEKIVGTPSEPADPPTPTSTPVATPTTGQGNFDDLNASVTVTERNENPNRLRSVEFTYTLESDGEVTFEVIHPDDGVIESETETGTSGSVKLDKFNRELPLDIRGAAERGDCYELTVESDAVDGTTYDLTAEGDSCDS